DSLDFRLIDYPIFNLADVFIVSGVALIILDMWLKTRTGQQKQENEKV
ncbi:signal peptidase II, partial [Paenibacillus xylanexedens]